MKKSDLGLLCCLLASACTVTPPFNRSDNLKQSTTPDATAIIALTHARLGEDTGKNDVFWEYTNKVLDSVAEQAGYLGHGVRLKLFGGEAWTMTAWEDQASLNSFVNSTEHRAAMKLGYAAIAEARFAQVTVKRSAVPIPWEQAIALLRDQGRGSE
jgi:heme-degrading monooxygenase HmoA